MPAATKEGLLSFLDPTLEASAPKGADKPIQIPLHGLPAYQVLWRVRDLFDGLATLLKSQILEEAGSLARSIFEDPLRMGLLRAAGSDS